MDVLILIGVISSMVWVFQDAKSIERTRHVTVGKNSAGMWVVGLILLWIVIFPLYLYRRSQALATSSYGAVPPYGGAPMYAAVPVQPVPGPYGAHGSPAPAPPHHAYCAACGAGVSRDARFCPACGATLDA